MGRDAPAFDSLPVAAQKKTEPQSSHPVRPQPQLQSDTVVLEDPPIIVVPELPVADVKPLMQTPMPSLNWDGNWPALAAALPLRGVVQPLAQQSELLQCDDKGDAVLMHLRIPLETLRSASAVDKLTSALSEHFSKTVRVTTEIGAVQQTANAQAVAEREARQRQAEESLQGDPFVQTMMREFGATIVPGSIKPA
jgi:DNA polymerase-3 subunit gamma/tau